MKPLDFNFFDDSSNQQQFNLPIEGQQHAAEIARDVARIKEQHLRIAIIEIEGSLPSAEQIRNRGRVEQSIDGSEVVLWDGKPILLLGPLLFSKRDGGLKPEFTAKFLYSFKDERE